MKNPSKYSFPFFLSSGFYSGVFPFAPGTAGTLAYAILLYLFLDLFPITLTGFLLMLLALTVIGIWSTWALLRDNPSLKDPKFVVIDEWIGFHIAVVPIFFFPDRFDLIFIAAFFLFRFFDVTKLSIVRFAEELPGAWGVIADDMVAGIISASLVLTLF